MQRTLSAIHAGLTGPRGSTGTAVGPGEREARPESGCSVCRSRPERSRAFPPRAPPLLSRPSCPSAPSLSVRPPPRFCRFFSPLGPPTPTVASCHTLAAAAPAFTNSSAGYPPSDSTKLLSAPPGFSSSSWSASSPVVSGGERDQDRSRVSHVFSAEETEGEERVGALTLKQFRRRGTISSPVGLWNASFNVFPATQTRHSFVDFSPEGFAFCDGFGGPRASTFASRHFFSLLDEHRDSPDGAASSLREGDKGQGGALRDREKPRTRQGLSRREETLASDFPTLNWLLRTQGHSALIRGLDSHFAALDRAYLDYCNRDVQRMTQGASVCAAFFGAPLGALVCTLGDVGAVLVVRDGQHARRKQREEGRGVAAPQGGATSDDRARGPGSAKRQPEETGTSAAKLRPEKSPREWTPAHATTSKEPSSDGKKETPAKACSCSSCSCSVSGASSPVSEFSPPSSRTSVSSQTSSSDTCLPLVAWRLADPHNAENPGEMTRLHAHPRAKSHSLLQGQLIKGVSPATRAIGAFHLKDPELNAELPAGLRVANYGRNDLPLLSNRPDYTLQPFHPDVEGLIVGSAGFWKLLSPEEAASLLDVFITCQHTTAFAKAKGDTSSTAALGPADDDAATFLLRAALVELSCQRERLIRARSPSHRAMEAAGLPHWGNVKEMVLSRQATLGDFDAQLQMIKQLEDMHGRRSDDARLDSLSVERLGLLNSDIAVCVVLRDYSGSCPREAECRPMKNEKPEISQ
uniref:Protein phosphatase 2C domain-containing protein n=1 Tax=Neospora caninum (strain Liverpool) TaxID=572307 RepID=A0A0F7U880_NEOCL|nr:TPA: protein phosphatase 2C domain-containing protein [Neospora caninum Liverpool]